MTDLTKLTLSDALDGMSKGDFSSVELTDAHIEACTQAKGLNAFITDTHDLAREQAKASDARRAKGEVGKLEGAPLAVKDLFCTEGVKTCAGSKILGDFTPTYESSVTANMKADGMVMLGKLNLDEFAMGSSNETSAYGPVINPWRKGEDLVPGGSSGGSAAAVAADICLGATATDTGGSIRQPASFTGTVGIKPTYGRCSRWGTVAFASSLDQAGPIAKTVKDSAILLESMAGYDPKDSTSIDAPIPNGMRYGARVDGADLNDTYEKTRAAGFGQEVQRRIMIGTYVLSAGYYDAYYLQAQKVRTRIVQDFENAWESCDAILTPTAPSAPFAVGRKVNDPIKMYLNDIFTVTTNLAGLPGISVPAGLDGDGLPLGLQIIGKAMDESTVFAAACALEKAAGFTARPEKWWA